MKPHQLFCYDEHERFGLAREALLKGQAEYSRPPCITSFDFSYIELIINFFIKTNYHNEEVNSTESSPLLS